MVLNLMWYVVAGNSPYCVLKISLGNDLEMLDVWIRLKPKGHFKGLPPGTSRRAPPKNATTATALRIVCCFGISQFNFHGHGRRTVH